MDDDDNPKRRHRAIPSSRAARLGAFGRLAGGVASGMLGEGARRLARGERPRMRDLVLTPGNVGRLADRLSHLRGAAMKLGQMISMDAGDLLPPELAAILAHNRDEEKEHAAMVLEWIRRKDPTFDKELKDFLFTEKPIAHK